MERQIPPLRKHHAAVASESRLRLVDAMRAMVATMIVWHHFAQYGPLASWATPVLGGLMDWLQHHRYAVPVFFIIGGYVMARSMERRTWNGREFGRFVARRYCRLGLPYLATIALAIVACAVGRGWLSESFVGAPPTIDQVLAHVVLLQDILGYESLSAGLWFVCIDFQLGLTYVAMLYVQEAFASLRGRSASQRSAGISIFLGWALAVPSLFIFNLDDNFDIWSIYFFGQFFMGVMVYHALKNSKMQLLFGLYVVVTVGALIFVWRWRLAISLGAGLVLFFGGKLGLMDRWPASRVIAYLGRTSYSLFLIHFPVLVVVSTVWAYFDWSAPSSAVFGLVVAYAASLLAAHVFHHAVENPAIKLSHGFS